MRKFVTVLEFELKNYFSSKGFMIFTIVFALLGFGVFFLPNVFDMSGLTGVKIVGGTDKAEESEEEGSDAEEEVYLYLDQAGVVQDEVLTQLFPGMNWKKAVSVDEIKTAVENQEAEAGFVVTSPTEYDCYLYNKGLTDSSSMMFEQAMKLFYRMNYCSEHGLDLTEIAEMYDIPVSVNETILNKDTGSNYWYCYFLVIIVFMLIVFYGQMIAVTVTNEKSNRAIEVLVTSTTSNSLLFGKVIAGALAGLFQVGIIMGGILVSYRINREAWGGVLDIVFSIPTEVIVTFAFFGLGGYLFYAFLYGAMGALVSKTEDVSKSSSSLMMIIMVVYFFTLFQLTNVEGPVIKVLSFLPISSYSSMFARIAMGTVATWEIVVSFLILVASIIGAGVLGAKIYRMGTLRYGNPIKLSTALKDLKKNQE